MPYLDLIRKPKTPAPAGPGSAGPALRVALTHSSLGLGWSRGSSSLWTPPAHRSAAQRTCDGRSWQLPSLRSAPLRSACRSLVVGGGAGRGCRLPGARSDPGLPQPCGRGLVAMSGRVGAAEAEAAAAGSRSVPGVEVLRLSGVAGWGPDKTNDLLLGLGPEPGMGLGGRRASPHHLLYFPGDVQDYHELMIRHPENVRWQQWSLEEVAVLLFHRFPNSHIWIIKASRMHLHKFNCYDNFVQSNLFGVPEHSSDCRAFKHLYSLLMNGFKEARTVLRSRTNADGGSHDSFTAAHDEACSGHSKIANGLASKKDLSTPSLSGNYTEVEDQKCTDPSLKFTLVGFSKGCVVLNQLLYELNEAQKNKELAAFINNITAMYWLDGGHAGGSNTWVTDPEILKGLAKTGIPVHAHVTPYQVRDSMRAWIGKEHKKFIRLLTEFGAKVTNQLHFENETPSLENHFRILQVF